MKPLKSEYGGGMKEFVCEDQDCFAGVEDEASFLTSQERQSIVLHFLNELRATGDDSLEGIAFIEGQPIGNACMKFQLWPALGVLKVRIVFYE